MNREELKKEAQEQVNYCTPLYPESFIQGYLAGAEPREKRIVELEGKLEQTEKDLADYQFNYPKIKELEKENAELKAGRPQWHDLEKEPTDLPKDNHNVWCKALDHYGEGWYDKDTNTWTLIYRGYHLHCIEAWCEIPTFDKE